MTMKVPSPMRVHSDITCLHPASEDTLRGLRCASTPRTFELSFGHRVALLVSLSARQFLMFAVPQELMNHPHCIYSLEGFPGLGLRKQMTPTPASALLCCVNSNHEVFFFFLVLKKFQISFISVKHGYGLHLNKGRHCSCLSICYFPMFMITFK